MLFYGSLPPPWPNQTQASVFMTAVNFAYNPFPTRVYYDWDQQAQNSSVARALWAAASSQRVPGHRLIERAA